MTTASPSIPIDYISDTPNCLRISIPGLIVNTSDYKQHQLKDTDTVPDHPILRGVFEQLRSDNRIEAIVVTNYGLEVYHDHVTPLDIIRLIEPVVI